MREIFTAGVALFIFIFSGLIPDEKSYASTLDNIRVLKISGQDQRAVIKDLDGKARVIRPGDPIGKSGKVVEITADRIVIEEKKDADIEKIIVTIVDGKQSVERLSKNKKHR